MRTIKQWLEKAKEQGYDWADAAIRNYYPDYSDDNTSDTLCYALLMAFDWEYSPEGDAFWSEIYEDLVNKESLYDTDTISELVIRYMNTKIKLNTLQPDTSLSEPFRQAAFKVYKNSYTNDLEDLAQQIAERIGFWDKYNSLQKELEACKKTSEEVHNLYIDEVKKNFENIHIIAKLEKEIEFLKNRRVVEGWIVQNEDKSYSIIAAPTIYKDDGGWIYNQAHNPPDWVDVPENDLKEFNCKIPKWEDDEPTPIYK